MRRFADAATTPPSLIFSLPVIDTIALHPGRAGSNSRRDALVGWWLLAVCVLIFAMVVLGGVTRLTDSGLSIVEWQPLMGALPPMDEAAWNQVFERYKAYPEYQKVNAGMTLAEFKTIFWFEYAHRLLGRVIGLAFLLPFLAFLVARRIDGTMVPRLVVLFVLGGLQGLLGWFMVQSGLVDRPDVSQYRLTAHLGLAVLIYGFMFWTALSFIGPPRGYSRLAPRGWFVRFLVAWVFLVILSGGFVAGTDAGFAYNTFPLMDGRFVPLGLFDLSPTVLNFFENTITIQFTHRVLGVLTVAMIVLYWLFSRMRAHPGVFERRINLVALAAVAQVALGILTLLLVVPIPLAAAHQAGGLLLLTATIYAVHAARSAS
jgi:cytochrome c oxidase assembly protein subunit 15